MRPSVVRRERPGRLLAAEHDVSLWDALGLSSRPPVWQDSALCAQVDPDLWFPESGQPTAAVKGICGGCPVRGECLADALSRGERFGIWGGLSTEERRRFRQRDMAGVVEGSAVA